MLLLGVLAAQAEGAVAVASDYDLLETEILTGTQASVTFSSLNSTYGADYQHLQIRVSAKSTRTGGSAEMYGTANGLTQYWNHWLVGSGSSVSSANFSYSKMFFGNMPGSDTSSDFNAAVIDLLDPFNTSKNKTVRTLIGTTVSPNRIAMQSSIIPTTTALNTFSLEIEPASNFTIGSRFSLYGLRSA